MNTDTARAIMPTYPSERYRTPTNEERLAQYRSRRDSTATTPAGDTDANRQDGSPATIPQPPRAGSRLSRTPHRQKRWPNTRVPSA
jgi:hypothetical protein